MTNPNIMSNILTFDEINMVRDCLINSYLEAIHIQKQRSLESENASNIEKYMMSLMYDYDYRELSEEEIIVLVREANNSKLYRWFFNRVKAALNLLAIDQPRLEKYIAKTMVFQTTTEALNEFESSERCGPEQWTKLANNHPMITVILLWVGLSIPLHIQFIIGNENGSDAGSKSVS